MLREHQRRGGCGFEQRHDSGRCGTYHEDVVVPMPLSIVGAGAGQSIVDATGLCNGFDIDGHHHPDLSHVLVTGFTVENANFQGILITDSSYDDGMGQPREWQRQEPQCGPAADVSRLARLFCGG
jgi:hypothetical protein